MEGGGEGGERHESVRGQRGMRERGRDPTDRHHPGPSPTSPTLLALSPSALPTSHTRSRM